jgi:hypothetical protein
VRLGDHDLPALRAIWQARGTIRIERFLADDVAVALRDTARRTGHELMVSPPDRLAFQYWAATLVPEAACDHPLCEFGRWLWSDALAWVSALTDLPLVPPEDRLLMATHHDKGSYLDPHDDWDGARKIAFVLGLTEDRWPADQGGHLEFLGADDQTVRVVERRAPGWNTLDLFDVRDSARPHMIPILQRRAERRAISGWFY